MGHVVTTYTEEHIRQACAIVERLALRAKPRPLRGRQREIWRALCAINRGNQKLFEVGCNYETLARGIYTGEHYPRDVYGNRKYFVRGLPCLVPPSEVKATLFAAERLQWCLLIREPGRYTRVKFIRGC